MINMDCFAKILAKRADQEVVGWFKLLDLLQVVQVEPLLNPLTLVGKYQAKYISLAFLFGDHWASSVKLKIKNVLLNRF